MPGRERHSLHLHASTKAGVDEILRPCLSASASQKRQFTEAEARVRGSSLPTWCTRPGPAAGTRRHSRRSSASWTPCVTRRRGRGGELQEPRAVRQIQEAAPGHHPTRRPHPAAQIRGGDGGGGRGDRGRVWAAHLFCHRRQGSKLFVLLRNWVNSLYIVSATSLVMFKVIK